jgi:hypothetical protein
MLKSCQSIYVTVHRWTFRNFGQGKAPQSKALFNASFVLIVLLTGMLLAIDALLHSGIIAANSLTDTAILLAMVTLLFVNHLLFLNNRLLRKVDERLTIMSRHNRNVLALVVLAHVIVICGIFLFTL